MFVQRRAGRLAAGLVLAFVFVLSAVLVWPAALGAAGPLTGYTLYAPLIQRTEPTVTPVPTATPTPTPTTQPAGCSSAPVLTSPANGATLDTLIPVLAWDSGQNPSATETNVQVYADGALTRRVDWFLSRYRTTGAISWQPSDNYQPATTYYWLTFLMCGDVRGPTSEVRSFIAGSGGVVLPAPSLIEPADGVQLSGTTLTVSWSAIDGALGYEQYMNKPGSRMWRNTGSSTTVWSGLQANTVYEWYVRARNSYAWGAESARRHFTTGSAAPAWSEPLPAAGAGPRTYMDGNGRMIEADQP